MSDRIAAAEAILATLAAGRGRVASLAHAYLPFKNALAIELRATVGASPERVNMEIMTDLLDRRLSHGRRLFAPILISAPAPMPQSPLPVSVGPEPDEDVEDVPTPVSIEGEEASSTLEQHVSELEIDLELLEVTPDEGLRVGETEATDTELADDSQGLFDEPEVVIEEIDPLISEEEQLRALIGEQDEPPVKMEDLVRFVPPKPPVLEPEPVTEDDIDDELLAEAVDQALTDDEDEVEDSSMGDSPTVPGHLFEVLTHGDGPLVSGEDGISEEDGGTEVADEREQDEPPVIAMVRAQAAVEQTPDEAEDALSLDDEPSIPGPAAEADEEAEPPRRDGGRYQPASVQMVLGAKPRPAMEPSLEASAPEDEDEDEGSPASGFSVTLERPFQDDDEISDEEPPSATGPRLTDESEMYDSTAFPDEPSSGGTVADPHEVAEFLRRSREAEGKGDLNKARDHYSDLLDLAPENVEAWLGRGRCLMEMGDYSAAMSDFQRAEDLDPKSPQPLVEMGNLFFARKEYRRAIEFYDHALDIDPDHAMARCRRGICHQYRKNYQQARADLERARRLDPTIPNIGKYIQMVVKEMERNHK